MRAALAVVATLFGGPAMAEGIASARYTEATTRYDHGILGDAVEWAALEMTTDTGRRLALRLPLTRVFEDLEPRLIDLDSDGANEVLTIETDIARGARLAVYGAGGLIAANDFIDRTHRWLAPLGAADLDGDGRVEIAFVDRPHLARTLILVQQRGNRLVRVGQIDGLTNHRIGDDWISGGIAVCGGVPTLLLATADWTRARAVTWDGTTFAVQDRGPVTSRSSLTARNACP